jgi:hypothetical protein
MMSVFGKKRNIVGGISSTPVMTNDVYLVEDAANIARLDKVAEIQTQYADLQNSYAQGKISANAITAAAINAATIDAGPTHKPTTLWIGITPAENGYLVKVEETTHAFAPQKYKTYVAATFEEVQNIVATVAVTQKLNASG